MFPLSKLLDPTDYTELAPEVAIVDEFMFGNASGQASEHRRWEYAMALLAIKTWWAQSDVGDLTPLEICDVGGAGSGFWQALIPLTTTPVLLVDPGAPATPPPGVALCHGTLEDYAATAPHNQYDILTCISVIEHVDQPRTLLRAAHMLLKPGGLLFLTTDCWNCDGPDVAHFNWMRKRIYNPGAMRKLAADLRELGFRSFGPSDWTYPCNTVYDYSFSSLCMVKK